MRELVIKGWFAWISENVPLFRKKNKNTRRAINELRITVIRSQLRCFKRLNRCPQYNQVKFSGIVGKEGIFVRHKTIMDYLLSVPSL